MYDAGPPHPARQAGRHSRQTHRGGVSHVRCVPSRSPTFRHSPTLRFANLPLAGFLREVASAHAGRQSRWWMSMMPASAAESGATSELLSDAERLALGADHAVFAWRTGRRLGTQHPGMDLHRIRLRLGRPCAGDRKPVVPTEGVTLCSGTIGRCRPCFWSTAFRGNPMAEIAAECGVGQQELREVVNLADEAALFSLQGRAFPEAAGCPA